MENDEINLELRCDLTQASKFYGVDIDDIEIREYKTPFTITQEQSSMSLAIACTGCNELIKIDIIELPRINNLKSSSFLVQVGIILTLVLLPTINVNINRLSIEVLAALGILFFIYELYSFFIRAPARLDTLFFWHSIKTRKKDAEIVKQTIQPREDILPDRTQYTNYTKDSSTDGEFNSNKEQNNLDNTDVNIIQENGSESKGISDSNSNSDEER